MEDVLLQGRISIIKEKRIKVRTNMCDCRVEGGMEEKALR